MAKIAIIGMGNLGLDASIALMKQATMKHDILVLASDPAEFGIVGSPTRASKSNFAMDMQIKQMHAMNHPQTIEQPTEGELIRERLKGAFNHKKPLNRIKGDGKSKYHN